MLLILIIFIIILISLVFIYMNLSNYLKIKAVDVVLATNSGFVKAPVYIPYTFKNNFNFNPEYTEIMPTLTNGVDSTKIECNNTEGCIGIGKNSSFDSAFQMYKQIITPPTILDLTIPENNNYIFIKD